MHCPTFEQKTSDQQLLRHFNTPPSGENLFHSAHLCTFWLHGLTCHSFTSVVQLRLLVELGRASLSSTNESGCTALQLARNEQSINSSSIQSSNAGNRSTPILEYLEWAHVASTSWPTATQEQEKLVVMDRKDSCMIMDWDGMGGWVAAAEARFGPVCLDTIERVVSVEEPAAVDVVVVAGVAERGPDGGEEKMHQHGAGSNSSSRNVGCGSGDGRNSGTDLERVSDFGRDTGGGGGGRVAQWARLADGGNQSMSGEQHWDLGAGCAASLIILLIRAGLACIA